MNTSPHEKDGSFFWAVICFFNHFLVLFYTFDRMVFDFQQKVTCRRPEQSSPSCRFYIFNDDSCMIPAYRRALTRSANDFTKLNSKVSSFSFGSSLKVAGVSSKKYLNPRVFSSLTRTTKWMRQSYTDHITKNFSVFRTACGDNLTVHPKKKVSCHQSSILGGCVRKT